MAGPHNYFVIGPQSATPKFGGTGGSILIGFLNQSKLDQTNSFSVYDGPSVAAVQAAISANANQTTYPLIVQPLLAGGIGQFLDMTFMDQGLKLQYGIVIIPAGVTNTDGGVTVLYD